MSNFDVNPVAEKRPKGRFSLGRTFMMLAVAVGIFALGWAGGGGRITIGKDAVFRQAVSKNLPTKLDYSSVDSVYNALRTSYDGQLDVNKLLDGLKAGLAQATGDPYTEYFNPADAKKFNEQLSGSFTGIGAQLGKDADGNLEVIAPIAGFPADKAGLRPKDIIAQIDGTTTTNMNIDDAVTRIRGAKDTKVTLKIIRDKSQTLSFTITRDDIKIPSVTSRILDGTIGYMQISEFSDDTSQLATAAANNFKQAGVKGVILDVRGDPGGLLNAAVDVSSLWLNHKTVLTERRDGVVVQTYQSHNSPILEGIPTVVLIDSGSASASEITAGALHDNGAAKLLGVTSYGKGSVQEVVNLNDASELKVTIARWYTPGGKNIDKKGIDPDQKVARTDDDIKAGRDPQLDAATQALSK